MQKYEIVTNKKELSIPVRTISLTEAEEKELVNDMLDVLRKERGIGLSANQIGVNERICVINVKKPIHLVNPQIVEVSDEVLYYHEGCLSFPSTRKTPKRTIRHKTVKVSADNYANDLFFCPDNEPWANAEAFYADLGLLECICVQHEIGHLDGKCVYDVLATPPRVKEKSYGRNERVMVVNDDTKESKYLKYKHAIPLLDQGWVVI